MLKRRAQPLVTALLQTQGRGTGEQWLDSRRET